MWKLFSALLMIISTPSCATASATVHSYLSDHAFLYMSGHALLRKALLFVPRAKRAYRSSTGNRYWSMINASTQLGFRHRPILGILSK